MNDRELAERDAAYQILSACQLASPTGKEQAAFARRYNELVMDGISYSDIILTMAERLADGLRHGNWPD